METAYMIQNSISGSFLRLERDADGYVTGSLWMRHDFAATWFDSAEEAQAIGFAHVPYFIDCKIVEVD